MFFFGFLIAFAILVFIISLLTKLLPEKLRSKFVMIVIAIPITFPFWHYVYPSYYTFQELCASPERYVVRKVVEVDFLNEDGCWRAFKKSESRAFKGFECPWHVESPPVIVQGVKPYARFVRGDNWDTPVCQDQCVKANYNSGWERECLSVCFKATHMPEPSFKYEVIFGDKQLVEDRLFERLIQFVDSNREELATLKDYTYYPYGNGFAKILGLASGSAPTTSCEKRFDIFELDFLKPSKSR
ncbi:MAG: hypothetical protein EAZ92_00360 [Candidatus Kapaibacterium sp.]|nr:MAG: hypothetical protein EAZ92_00360 [Candidatus Kapabacteria bacterium]